MRGILQRLITAAISLAFFAVLPGFADVVDAENGTITGVVLDDSTATPVSYASVALLNADDSVLISGMITNDLGKFQFENIPYGKYTLKVTFVGYKPFTIRDLEVSKQNRSVDLREMKMKEDYKTISEAVIVGQRLKGEEKIDRTVFTLNDDIRKASNDALDALKHIPSVSVDFQNNVALEGQTNIQFYVDGVLRNKDYVAQLKPDVIDKIELITNPGVNYDADVSGVINIVLKKEKRYGISGSVKVPIPHPSRIVAEPTANIEYGNQRFRFYVGDRMHFERFEGTEFLTTEVGGANPYDFEKTGEGTNSWRNNYLNYGIDWFINDRTSLNFLGEWRTWTGVSEDYKYDSKVYTNDELTEYLKTNKSSFNKNDNYYFSLFFKRKFKKDGDEFKAEAYYNRQTGNETNEYEEYYMDPSEITFVDDMVNRNDITDNLRNNVELKFDASFLIKNVRNEVGTRTYGAWMNNSFTNRYTIEDVTDESIEEFEYNENRQTAFYNLSGKIKKFAWQAGLRGEYTWIDVNSASASDYALLLPQVSFNQSLPKEQNVKFSWRKQVFRPSISSLNPFEQWTDSMHLRVGNPNLDPALENRFELTYSKNFKSNYLSPKAYFRYTNNGIQDVTEVTPEGVTMITQDNVGRNMEYGLGLNAALQVMKRWRFNANVTAYKQIYQTDEAIAGHSKEEMFSYRFNFSNIVTLPKDYTLFMFANYGSPSISYQREFSRQLLALIGAEKKFNDKWSADVFYNPFIKDFMYSKVITTTTDYRETWEGHVNANQLFCFSVTYSFNKGGKINKIDRNVEYDQTGGKGGL